MMLFRCLIAGVLIAGFGTASAQTNSGGANASSVHASEDSPPKLFNSLTAVADMDIFTCSMQARNVLLGISLGKYNPEASDKLGGCIEDAKAKAQTRYGQVKGSIKGNKEAMSAVNDYAASLFSLLDDLRPRTGETSEQRYGYRIDAAESDLKKKANFTKLQLM